MDPVEASSELSGTHLNTRYNGRSESCRQATGAAGSQCGAVPAGPRGDRRVGRVSGRGAVGVAGPPVGSRPEVDCADGAARRGVRAARRRGRATSGWSATGSRSTPVAGATTIADGGFVLPGLVDAHCHIGIARRRRADLHVRRGAGAGPRRPGRRRAGDPRRRLAVPVPGARRRPGHAAAGPRRPARRAAPKRYLRGIGVEVLRRRAAGRGGRAGPGRQRLGQAGRRLDRPGRRRPRAGLGRRRCWPPRSPPRTPPGARVAVHTFAEESVVGAGPGRRRLGRARHRTVRRRTSTRWPAAARRWCPR